MNNPAVTAKRTALEEQPKGYEGTEGGEAYGLFAVAYAPRDQPVLRWVEEFDLEANGGEGNVKLTALPFKALRFASVADALAYTLTQPVKKTRADGQPNRPLRAFDMEIRLIPASETQERTEEGEHAP